MRKWGLIRGFVLGECRLVDWNLVRNGAMLGSWVEIYKIENKAIACKIGQRPDFFAVFFDRPFSKLKNLITFAARLERDNTQNRR